MRRTRIALKATEWTDDPQPEKGLADGHGTMTLIPTAGRGRSKGSATINTIDVVERSIPTSLDDAATGDTTDVDEKSKS